MDSLPEQASNLANLYAQTVKHDVCKRHFNSFNILATSIETQSILMDAFPNVLNISEGLCNHYSHYIQKACKLVYLCLREFPLGEFLSNGWYYRSADSWLLLPLPVSCF